ncbi:uncharacterized protein LOC110427831 [Herrania umbratica]|uniref:Uncharacterized protein LOC110427831 n=1 Tax=Herrania umbratica TaxID=108875 RepID=A0A6J1BJ57_9ROSI|nr:uncharacterized protein LOC110427831 [Herrania umbratica]XP_021299123.1 uncharacterized protein LOC110427831 [Herrania umbratica]
MNGGDPWRMLKCAAGVQDKTIINQMMLRFRPIAPKPVTGDSVSAESMFSSKNLLVSSKRAKRKYVRVCKKNNRKRRILDEVKDVDDGKNNSVTLQLMPEKADLEKLTVVERSLGVDLDRMVGNNYHFQDPPSPCFKLKKMVTDNVAMMGLSDQTAVITSPRRRLTVVESWVTVESVTDTCMDEGEMANCTDVEKMKYLENDTCPGFVSDGLNWVLWVNRAYKNAVAPARHDSDGEPSETAVGLVVKDGCMLPLGAFSCRVRLQYWDEKGKKYSKMVPCDVWKMRSGGFAWRLDVKAALSLGL